MKAYDQSLLRMNKVEYDLLDVLGTAATMEEFLRLTGPKIGCSLNQAARKLDKSPSYFSGENSMLARYNREGVIGLLSKRPSKNQDLIKQILFQLRKQQG